MNRFKGSLVLKLFFLFILLSFVPITVLVILTSRTSRSVEEISIKEGSSAMIEETRIYLRNRTVDYARQINLQLERIESDARVMASHAREILGNRSTYSVPWRPERYEEAENGIFWTPRDYGGSNLFVSRRTTITSEIRRKISTTELLDPIMKEIYENDPNTIYIFFAGEDNLVRGYPWFDAMSAIEGGTLDPDLNLKEEPLFYLASPEGEENREEVWSEVYLDAAGRGWMVTCVSPVFHGETFLGVVGIDVSLDRIRENVLDLELSGDGYAFLLNGSGNVLASPPESAEGLGWEVGMTPDRFNLLASSNLSMAAVARGMIGGTVGIKQAVITGRDVLVSYAPVETAHWSLGLAVSVEDITRRALMTAGQIEQQTGKLIRHMMLISTLLLVAVAIATFFSYRKITGPLNELVDGAMKIADGNLGYRVRVESRDEIGKLSRTFNMMVDSLQKRDDELTKVQAKLLESERLSSMGTVAAAVAHEIRNALGTIKNSIYYVKQKVKNPDLRIERHLSIMDEEIESADNIVSELLDFTRGSILQMKEVSINILLMEVLAVFKEKESVNISVEKNLDESLPQIMADPAQVRHVFYNVIQNSYQALDDGENLRVDTRSHNGNVQIIVKDSGHGIKDDEISRLFEPFFTTKARGIGLGLAISRKIVESHGGTIHVESDPGVGTTVTIELPFQQAKERIDHK